MKKDENWMILNFFQLETSTFLDVRHLFLNSFDLQKYFLHIVLSITLLVQSSHGAEGLI